MNQFSNCPLSFPRPLPLHPIIHGQSTAADSGDPVTDDHTMIVRYRMNVGRPKVPAKVQAVALAIASARFP